MGRLIDAEWLKAQVHNVVLANGALHGCVDKLCIDEAPSIDIVRCGECIRRKKNKFCLELNRYAKDDNGHCSWGVKETDHE